MFKKFIDALINFFNKQNGWQRIYTVILLFFYIPICSLVITKTDTPDISLKELYKKVDSILLNAAIKDELNIYEPNYCWSSSYKEEVKFPYKKYKIEVASRCCRIDIDQRIGEEKINTYLKIFDNNIQQIYSDLIFNERMKWILINIASVLFIYALGYSLGWIYRGFKRK
jgi:hypothetical protein